MLKTVSSITNSIGALNYKGTWNANTNTPALASGVGTKGDYYVVSVAGTTNLDGIATWYVGDWAAFNGSVWQRLEGGVDDPAPSLKSNSSTGLMQISGPSAGQTRTVTIPDANSTMARTDAAQGFTGTQTFNGDTVSLSDVYGKQIMSGTGNTNPFTITVTGMLGIGQGGERDQRRLNLLSVYTSGPSHVGHAYALYTSEYNGNAILIATLGSSVVGGSITFGTSGANPTVTVNNSGGTVDYKINAIPLV
jgi:hypothetical protein